MDLPIITPFSGHQNFTLWSMRFDLHSAARGWDETTRCGRLPLYLSDEIFAVFTQFPESVPKSFNSTMKRLEEIYGSPMEILPTDSGPVYLHRLSGESIDAQTFPFNTLLPHFIPLSKLLGPIYY